NSMIMKNILLLISFLAACSITQAQKIRFTDTSNEWNLGIGYLGSPPGTFQYSYRYIRDTVINGFTYSDFGFGYVREDSSIKKVYVKNLNRVHGLFILQLLDTNEIVLYDYNLQVGDSQLYTFELDSFKHFKNIVTGIDSTRVNNTWHRLWHF